MVMHVHRRAVGRLSTRSPVRLGAMKGIQVTAAAVVRLSALLIPAVV